MGRFNEVSKSQNRRNSKNNSSANTRKYEDRAIEKVRKNLLYHFMQRFFAEEAEMATCPARIRRSTNKSQTNESYNFGFSRLLGNRSYEGYTKLDTEPPLAPSSGGQVILDPHAPLTWSTKSHFVQNPTRYDALESLSRGGDSDEESFTKKIEGNLKEIKLNSSSSSSTSASSSDRGDSPEKSSSKSSKKAEKEASMKFLGIFLAAVSGLFFTLCSVTVKLLPRIDPSEVLVFRAVIQLILTIPMMMIVKKNPLGPKGVRILVYLQGLIGCLTVSCIFIGFARLPVGDAATIIFCSPIFVMIFSHVILREHCGIFRVLVISMLLFGVILIAKPPFLHRLIYGNNDNSFDQTQSHADFDMIGYGAALAGTLLTASNFVCMRKLKEVHFSVLIFAFSIMSGIISTVIVFLVAEFKLPRNMEEWVYAILVGIFGLLGQSLLALALRYETAGVVSVTRSMDIAVAYIIQIVWFGDIPVWTSILGAFVVVLAVFTMAMETAVLHILKSTFGSSGWC